MHADLRDYRRGLPERHLCVEIGFHVVERKILLFELFFVIFHSSTPISMSEILLKPKNNLELCLVILAWYRPSYYRLQERLKCAKIISLDFE